MKSRRIFRILHVALKIVVGILVGVAALFVAVLFSLRFAFVQKKVAAQANTALSDMFLGRIVIDELGNVGLGGVSGFHGRVLDAKGRTVIHARGADVDFFWPSVVWQALVTKPAVLSIDIQSVKITDLRVRLIDAGDGTPTLVSAFNPREPAPEEESAGQTRVVIPEIAVRHAWVHGALGGAPPIDADLDHLGVRFALLPDKTELDTKLGRLRARSLPAGADPDGKLTASLRLPAAENAPMFVQGAFSGSLAKATADARVEMNGDKLAAKLKLTNVGPATFAKIAPAVAPNAPLVLDAEVNGTLAALTFRADTRGDAGEVRITGEAQLGDETRVRAKAAVRDLNASKLLADGPSTQLTADLDANARIDAKGIVNAKYDLRMPGGRVAAEALPPLTLVGDLQVGAESNLTGSGKLDVAEPGAATSLTYSLQDVGTPNGVVEIAGRVRVANPKRLAGTVSGTGLLSIDARIQPAKAHLDATVTGELDDLVLPETRVRRLEVKVAAAGPFENPGLAARLTAHELLVSDRRFSRVTLNAEGTQKQLDIDAVLTGKKPDQLRIRSRVAFAPSVTLSSPELSLSDGKDVRITVSANEVRVVNGGVKVDALELSGAGSARASLSYPGRLAAVDLTTKNLRPAVILGAIGIESPVAPRAVNVALHYAERQAGRPIGSITGTLEGVRVGKVEDGSVSLDFAVGDQMLSGAIEADVEGGRLRVTANEVKVPPQPWTQQSLETAQGELTANGRLDLHRLEPLITRLLPIGSARGEVAFDVKLARPREGAKGPRVSARIETKGLDLTGERQSEAPVETAEAARLTKPWTIQNIDFAGELELDTAAGVARLDAVVKDAEGPLLTAQASAQPEPARSFSALLQRELLDVPIKVRVTTPPRTLEELPEFVRPASLRGIAAIDVELEGTLRDPRLRADASVSCLGTLDTKDLVDLTLTAEYRKEQGRIAANATSEKRPIGELRARWDGDLRRLGDMPSLDQPSPVQGELALSVTRFPLQLIPALATQQVKGPISGNVRLEGFGRDARVTGRFQSDKILVGKVGVQNFDASFETTGDAMVGKVEIGGNRGIARAEVRAPLAWGNKMVPSVDPHLQGRLYANNFRIETLAPLVAGQVSELEGRLNANVQAEIAGNEPQVQGTLSLQRGVVHIPALGQRLRDIQAKVSIDKGKVRLERLTAKGVTGGLSVTGSAELDGVALRSAKAELDIDKDDKLPITVEGAAIGDAWGKVNLAVTMSEKNPETRVRVDVPSFHLEMPETTPAALQDLGPAEAVRIGTRLPDGNFVTIPVQPLEKAEPAGKPSTTRVEVTLGRDVWLRRGQQVQVQLGGKLQIVSGATTAMTGKIELQGGTLDVQGKEFDIERGVVSFTGGDPPNPTITAVARWDSPEGYTVYAEYSGTAEQGKLSLRAEPPLTENEILSLIMFGTPDGSFGSGEGGSNAQTALGVAGGTAAQGLNRVLSGITDLEVSARIDTSTGSSRPELVAQLTPRVTARLSRAVGEPTTGQSPDKTFLRVDFRIRRAWSLSTMVGDRGASALDLIWRKRY